MGSEDMGAGVVAFTYRGKLILMIPLDKETYAQVTLLITRLSKEGKTLGEWLREKIG
jgi:hypothetical protein